MLHLTEGQGGFDKKNALPNTLLVMAQFPYLPLELEHKVK